MFGHAVPFEQQYHQLVTIEWPGFNNTLAPYMTCKNAIDYGRTRAPQKMAEWIKRYLDNALQRVQPLIEGVTLRHRDLFNVRSVGRGLLLLPSQRDLERVLSGGGSCLRSRADPHLLLYRCNCCVHTSLSRSAAAPSARSLWVR